MHGGFSFTKPNKKVLVLFFVHKPLVLLCPTISHVSRVLVTPCAAPLGRACRERVLCTCVVPCCVGQGLVGFCIVCCVCGASGVCFV